ncbi:MAG: hypothetical protein Aurels2KO_09260 [Aureliella sp.]
MAAISPWSNNMYLRAIVFALMASSPVFAQKQASAQAAPAKAFSTKLINHASALPPVSFKPELTVKENNARLADREPGAYLLSKIRIETREISGLKDLVGRRCSVHRAPKETAQSRFYSGEVFAFSLSADRSECVVYVRVANQRDASGAWLLAPGQHAVVTIAANHPAPR